MIRGRRRAGALLPAACALLIAGCHPSRPATTPSSAALPAPAVAQLQREIDAALSEPALAPGTWGIIVRSLTRDDTLYALNARKLMTPASNLKIATLAAAAEKLGWEFTYETRVLGLGAIDFGFLDGDLIVSGSGDPSLSEEDGSAQRAFQSWADRLKALGVRSLSGRIIGDDNAFDDEPIGYGWMWDDLDQAYSAGIGALQLNVDATHVTIVPGASEGLPAAVTLASDGSGLTVRSHVSTSAAGVSARVSIRRLAGTAVLDVSGSVPVGSAPVQRAVAVENPTLYFVSELRKALVASGIDVRGGAADIDSVSQPPRVDDAVPLVVHRSPPLSVLADTLMKVSQNQYAETLLKTLGAQAGAATFEAGRRVVQEVLESWGVPPSDLFLADGSGLSRYNLITPQALVTVLTHVARDPRLKESFEASLPVAGVGGALAQRLKGVPTAGSVRAKTGSMMNARSISGYMQTADAEPVVFSIIVNNYGIPASEIDRVSDAILVKVAQFRR